MYHCIFVNQYHRSGEHANTWEGGDSTTHTSGLELVYGTNWP